MTRADDATTSVLYLTALGGALGQRVRHIAAAVTATGWDRRRRC